MSFIEDRKVSQHGLDYYATPDWATEALFDIVPEEWFDYDVWECACGEGHMSTVLKKRFSVIESDIILRPNAPPDAVEFDFLMPLLQPFANDIGMIITNPPFNRAQQFIERALNDFTTEVAILARLSFLESSGRGALFDKMPPNQVHVFRRRIAFRKGGDENTYEDRPGVSAHAWYIWSESLPQRTELKWIK